MDNRVITILTVSFEPKKSRFFQPFHAVIKRSSLNAAPKPRMADRSWASEEIVRLPADLRYSLGVSTWKLHTPTEDNRITLYRCGLIAGQRVLLKKDLVVTTGGIPTGVVHRTGEEWTVLPGATTDPVLWFRQPAGERCTWNDDAKSVQKWFATV